MTKGQGESFKVAGVLASLIAFGLSLQGVYSADSIKVAKLFAALSMAALLGPLLVFVMKQRGQYKIGRDRKKLARALGCLSLASALLAVDAFVTDAEVSTFGLLCFCAMLFGILSAANTGARTK